MDDSLLVFTTNVRPYQKHNYHQQWSSVFRLLSDRSLLNRPLKLRIPLKFLHHGPNRYNPKIKYLILENNSIIVLIFVSTSLPLMGLLSPAAVPAVFFRPPSFDVVAVARTVADAIKRHQQKLLKIHKFFIFVLFFFFSVLFYFK